MEENKDPLQSIWGAWWVPIRKWFYPAWFIYETSVRFYDYAISLYQYPLKLQSSIGENAAKALSLTTGAGTFIICFAFLTLPGTIALFKFFESNKMNNASFESRIKKIF